MTVDMARNECEDRNEEGIVLFKRKRNRIFGISPPMLSLDFWQNECRGVKVVKIW